MPPSADSMTQSSDGTRLRTTHWQPHGPVRAVLAFCHGAGEHLGRYAETAADLTADGLSLHMVDLRGHGESDGIRGHTSSFSDYLLDFTVAVQRAGAQAAESGVPLFIGGHSLGGLVALTWSLYLAALVDGNEGAIPPGIHSPDLSEILGTLQPKPSGTVLSAPFLGLAFQPPRWKTGASRILSRLTPALTMPTGLEPDLLSRDPAVVSAYRADGLVHGMISARAYQTIRAAQLWCGSGAVVPHLPMLVLIPGQDGLANSAITRTCAAALNKSGTVEVKEYPQLYHEVLNEPERRDVLRDLVGWVLSRIHSG